MTGTMYMIDRARDIGIPLTVPAADGELRFWRNTALRTWRPARRPRWATAMSATSGTRTWTTGSGPPA